MKAVPLLIALATFSSFAAQASQSTYAHGQGVLNLSLEKNILTINFDAPAQTLVGFEHIPTTVQEKAQFASTKARLLLKDVLFQFNPEAKCSLSQQALTEPKAANVPSKDPAITHYTMGATYSYECKNPHKINQLAVTLFDIYPKMDRILVKDAAGANTKQGKLTRKKNKITW
ncbi:MAG: ZrgA family zinc uptake protein [Vibrionaceae bacterium]